MERTVRSTQSVHKERLSQIMLGVRTPLPAPPRAQTARRDLPVRLADPVIGLDGVFLIHVLLTVGPTGPGVDVGLLEVPVEDRKNWLYK